MKKVLTILLVMVILLGLLAQVQATPPTMPQGVEWVPFFTGRTNAVGATQGKTFYYLKSNLSNMTAWPIQMYGVILVTTYCDGEGESNIKLSYSEEDGWEWAIDPSQSWHPIKKGSPLHFLLKALKKGHPDWFRNRDSGI